LKIESSLNTAKANLAETERLQKMAQKRRDRVGKFKGTLTNDYDNNVTDINLVVDKVYGNFEDAASGTDSVSTILTAIENNKEKFDNSDANLKSATSFLESEYNALDRYYNEKCEQVTKYHYQIGTLNSQLSSKRWELTQALAAEAREEAERRAKAALEAAKSLVTKKK